MRCEHIFKSIAEISGYWLNNVTLCDHATNALKFTKLLTSAMTGDNEMLTSSLKILYHPALKEQNKECIKLVIK